MIATTLQRKMINYLLLAGLVALGLLAGRAGRAAEGMGAPNPALLAEVRAGRRTTAEAAWWGFNPEDATAAVQSAVDSGARRVVLKDMGRPWVVEPIELAGDQELVLEKGVVLQARRGAFKRNTDCLLSVTGKKNVRLTGYGATLRMWRGDYARPPYTKSEYRHALSIKSCAGVRVAGLTIAESGGDGIYLGVAKSGVTNRDVEIRDVICERNYRQGISVISAERLLIARTILRDTSGTAPMAGIDFEPNNPDEKLVDCAMRDCVAENNAGDGITFYLNHLGTRSTPIGIRIENCRALGNRYGFRFVTGNAEPRPGVDGRVDVTGCRFEGNRQAGIGIGGKPAALCPARFERCVVAAGAQEKAGSAPIQFTSHAEDAEAVGGVAFVDCTVIDPLDRLPLGYADAAGGLKLTGVSGTLTVQHAGTNRVFALDQKLIDGWFPFQSFKVFPPYRMAGVRWEPVERAASPKGGWSCGAWQRGSAEYLIWAEAGQQVNFNLDLRRVGRTAPPKTPVTLTTPSGQERALAIMTAEGVKPYAFTAPETGAYRLVCKAGSAKVRIVASDRCVCLASFGGPIHLIGAAGDLYFYVPPGVTEFALRVSGEGSEERVKATVLNAGGDVVARQDGIIGHQFLCTRPAGAGAEIWRVRLEKPATGVIEDVTLRMQGLAPLLATAPEALLRPEGR